MTQTKTPSVFQAEDCKRTLLENSSPSLKKFLTESLFGRRTTDAISKEVARVKNSPDDEALLKVQSKCASPDDTRDFIKNHKDELQKLFSTFFGIGPVTFDSENSTFWIQTHKKVTN
jgi:hypothetical protein